MSKNLAIIAVTGLSLLAFQANAITTELTSSSQKLSYAIGYEMGQNFKNQQIAIDSNILTQGLQDALTGQKALLDKDQRKQAIMEFQKEIIAKQENQLKSTGEQNKKAGEDFLAQNAKKPNVVTLSDGLQYKILQAGTGPKPTLNDTVTVNYAGQLINGKIFDSSYQRGQPTTFAVNQVIKGWQEALMLMPTGSTWEIYVPANLAYGEHGMGPAIGPNETLIFKIDLISVKS